jgi:SAM-dependent methyltransferase
MARGDSREAMTRREGAETDDEVMTNSADKDNRESAMLARATSVSGTPGAPEPAAGSGGESAGDKPPEQRPERPEFWDQRFRRGVTPWDARRVPQQFADFAACQTGKPRCLIPGCGSAYEAAFLDRLGWPVSALDFSAGAIEAARRQLPDYRGQLLCDDFFTFSTDVPFEIVYERAFLCALPRKLWADWSRRMAELLAPGGCLAGYFFVDKEALKGPPFGIAPVQLNELCLPYFKLIDDQPAIDSIGPFAGRERWMVWRRLGPAHPVGIS